MTGLLQLPSLAIVILCLFTAKWNISCWSWCSSSRTTTGLCGVDGCLRGGRMLCLIVRMMLSLWGRPGRGERQHVGYFLLHRAKIQLTLDRGRKEKASSLLPCLLMKSPGQCLDLTCAPQLLENQLFCNKPFLMLWLTRCFCLLGLAF